MNEKITLKALYKKKAQFWENQRFGNSLKVFQRAAKEVPAYRDFLRSQNFNPLSVKSVSDWQKIPKTSKKNYLRRHPLSQLLRQGGMARPLTWTATSGSTGEPFYFPRDYSLDWQTSLIHEMFLENGSNGVSPTLVIDCFGMGLWIGGLITYSGFNIAANRGGYPLSIITPGINKAEIYKALKNIAPHFQQLIIAGYPPFVKDLIDDASRQGVDLRKMKPRFIFAAEAFTENFRDYIAKKSGVKNVCRDTLSIYGTADIGSMAFETPLAILIRRLAMKNPALFSSIFPEVKKIPTLVQYNPSFINFEEINGELFVTGESAIPLVRYALGDRGGVISFKEMERHLFKAGIDVEFAFKKASIGDSIIELPFVYVYERSDFSASLYGITIHPGMIRDIIIAKPLSQWLTGKFTLATEHGGKQEQYLAVHLELLPGTKVNSRIVEAVNEKITSALKKNSAEFHELSQHIQDRPVVKINLWPAEHPEFFTAGIKQKWIKKNELTRH